MKSHHWPLSRYQRISQGLGLIVIVLSGAALLGWFTGSTGLKGIRASYIPMAPNTSLLFILIGLGLFILKDSGYGTNVIARAASLVVLGLAGTRLTEYLVATNAQVDHWFLRFPAETLGMAPIGKMAFYTAVTFLLLGLALLFETLTQSRWANSVSKGLSLVVGFIGITFSLGYVYGAPLMYGGQSIPMALNTATCFVLCGASLLLKGSIRDIAERRQAKEALQQAHDELEEKVTERTVELRRAVDSLEAEIAERTQAQKALQEIQEQLLQAQKLEAVGRLAGGIAHDFNNLLTIIIGYSDLLMRSSALDERAHERVSEINGAANRASTLTRQLLAFSRKQVMKPEVIQINTLVAGINKMLARLIGEDIELIASLDPRVERITADPGQIEQVVINLVVNARDAMPNGGKITIETANVELDDHYADMHTTVKPGQYVMLAVSDTGCGIDAETRKHIFEPFFTTKEMGKGTGLGLSMIYGIVKQSGGNVWVYSELGKGSTFKIYLPRTDAQKAADEPLLTRRVIRSEANETILLVEDDERVRNLTRDILEGHGYRVLIAADGAEAIDISRAEKSTIHLLLTDVIMPKMNGKEVSERILTLHPEVTVLFMSGYTDDAIVHHGVLDPGTNLLQKPFTADGLVSKVREVLDRSPELLPQRD